MEDEDRRLDAARIPGRPGREGLGRRRRVSSRARAAAIAYVDVAYAVKNHIRFAAVQEPAGEFLYPSLRRIEAAALAFPKVPANNEMHIVESAEVGEAGLPDQHLHLRHRAQDDATCSRASEDDLLGTDGGSDAAVRGQAHLRTTVDGEDRAHRIREDAEDRSTPRRRTRSIAKAPSASGASRRMLGGKRAADAQAPAGPAVGLDRRRRRPRRRASRSRARDRCRAWSVPRQRGRSARRGGSGSRRRRRHRRRSAVRTANSPARLTESVNRDPWPGVSDRILGEVLGDHPKHARP